MNVCFLTCFKLKNVNIDNEINCSCIYSNILSTIPQQYNHLLIIKCPPNKFVFGKCFQKNYSNILSNFFFYLKVQTFRLIMENNFIKMALSAGHVVAYTIGPIFKHIFDSPRVYKYCPLKRQLSLVCRRNTYL